MDAERIEEQLTTLDRQLSTLPAAEQPPPTTLQLLGDATSERAWQQYLVHLLDPERPHGLDHQFLEHFLAGVAERTDLAFSFDRWALDTIQVAQEVSTDKGRPDVVIWAGEDWYLLLELKIDADEGADQTDRYADIDTFHGISLDAAAVHDGPGDTYRMYIAPEGAAEPSNDSFTQVSWSWVAEQLQTFVAEGHGAYPVRTTAQITDYIDTIQRELTMTDYQQNQREKMGLFVRYRDAIAEAESAFEAAWGEFQDTWGVQLAETLPSVKTESKSSVPDEYVVAIDDHGERWIFRQTHADWGWLFKDGWWRNVATGDPVYEYDASQPDARVGFLHRLDKHRENALQDHELKFFFRSTPPNVDAFDAHFDVAFGAEAAPEIQSALPERMSFTGGADTLLEGTYPIDYDDEEEFIVGYLDALATAVQENVIENRALVNAIDEQYETAFSETTAEW